MEVRRVLSDRDEFVFHLEDGASLRLRPAEVRSATSAGWGDGINGSEYEASLVIDHRLRLRGAPTAFEPVLRSLSARGVLRRARWSRVHPLHANTLAFVLFVVGIVLDLVVACYFVSRGLALAILAALAIQIAREHASRRR